MAAITDSRQSTLTTLLLVLLLTWSVGLRIWYGSKDLHLHRFWDEKFNVPNVHAVLERGTLTPERYAYLRLTYLPQAAVLGALGAAARVVNPEFSWFRGEVLRPGGFLVCRSIQAAIGGLSIFLTFLVGRRLFSASVGLLAALLVAASTQHLILSAIFKPDILAVATTMLAFLFSLWAIDRPTLWRYLLAGLGIGLAMSSKPTAGIIAIPLTLAALILGFKNRRHWLGLVSAGVTSVLVFLLLNPFPRYLRAFGLQRKRYNAMAAQKGTLGDPLATLHHELVTVFQGAHGIWIGIAAAVGFLFLGYQAWKGRREGDTTVRMAMFLVYPFSFVTLYGLVTQNVLPQNFLPVAPFTALAAAALLAAVWRWAVHRWQKLADRRITLLVSALLVLFVTYGVHAHAYRIVVPTTLETVGQRLARQVPGGTHWWIRVEEEGTSPVHVPREPGPVGGVPRGLLIWSSPRFSDVGQRILNHADALVFPLQRTRDPDSGFYSTRMRQDIRSRVFKVESRPFRAWGPDLVVVLRPWRALGDRAVELTREPEEKWFETRLPPGPGRQAASVAVWLPRHRKAKQAPQIRVDGRRVELQTVSNHGSRLLWITDRFPLPEDSTVEVRLRLPRVIQTEELEAEIHRWEMQD